MSEDGVLSVPVALSAFSISRSLLENSIYSVDLDGNGTAASAAEEISSVSLFVDNPRRSFAVVM